MHRATERVKGFYDKMKETARLEGPRNLFQGCVSQFGRMMIAAAYFFFFLPVSSGVAPGTLKSHTE